MSAEKKQPVIMLDREHNAMIDKNTQEAWLLYCRERGIDPNADELLDDDTTNDNGGNDR